MNGHVELRTLYIQAENEVLRSDDGLEHAKIFVGRLTFDRCLFETAEGMLLALAGGSVNSRSGEEVFAPRSKVLICPFLGLDIVCFKFFFVICTTCSKTVSVRFRNQLFSQDPYVGPRSSWSPTFFQASRFSLSSHERRKQGL